MDEGGGKQMENLMHYEFPPVPPQISVTIAEVTRNIAAAVEDTTDKAIVAAIIDAARAEGVTDLYLLDKTFILDAIREKQERENPKPLTIEELRKMNGEPVFIRKLDGAQSFWMLAYPDVVSNRLGWLDYRNYGSAWVAYRHKPKEPDSETIEVAEKYWLVTRSNAPFGHKRIAERCGCTAEALCKVNNITESTPLRPGQKLKLPKLKEDGEK